MCDMPLRGRSRLGGEDLRQLVDVGTLEDASAARLLQTRDELRAQQVDAAVEDAAAVRHLALLLLELVDQLLELLVGKRREIGKRFHGSQSTGGLKSSLRL